MLFHEYDKSFKGISKFRRLLVLEPTLPHVSGRDENRKEIIEKIKILINKNEGRILINIITNKIEVKFIQFFNMLESQTTNLGR